MAYQANNPVVILLHGLLRTPRAMQGLANALNKAGFMVENIGYPSRHHPIELLAREFILPKLLTIAAQTDQPLQFVTHSMGGIILRCLAQHPTLKIGRSVMLAPPNQGSELVDRMAYWTVFKWLNGPAGQQLGTTPASLPNRFGPVDFELGVIAGDRPINPFFARLIPDRNDGKVSVKRTQVKGMKALKIVPCTHSFMMNNPVVQQQTIHFLRTGYFEDLC